MSASGRPIRPRLHPDLPIDPLQVFADRLRPTLKDDADLRVGFTTRDPHEHLGLPRRKRKAGEESGIDNLLPFVQEEQRLGMVLNETNNKLPPSAFDNERHIRVGDVVWGAVLLDAEPALNGVG